MAAGVAASPQAQAALAQNRAIKRTLGRYSGPEFFVQQAATVNTAPVLVRPVPVGEAVAGLKGVLRMRVVIATANMTTVAAEAIASYVNRIFINGASAKFGQQTLWDCSGGTLFAWPRIFQNRDNSLYIGSTAATYTRINVASGTGVLGVPNTTPAATFGNTGTYDIEIHYDIPFVPVLGSSQRLNQLAYALRAEDWPNGLNVQFFFGDQNSFGTIGTATFTFTAFGSASGTPVMNVYTNTVLLNDLRSSHPSAVMIRQEQPAVQAVTAQGNNILFITPTRQRLMNILMKTGTTLGGAVPNVSFGVLSDFIVGNVLLRFNGTTPRNFQDWWAQKEYYGLQFESTIPGGYAPISFIEASNFNAALDATKLPPGADFTLLASVLTTGATQQVFLTQEYAIGDPQTRLPGQPA